MVDKISIIMPIYKTERFKLERAIASCLTQSYKNYEIILIDDNEFNDYVGTYIDQLASMYKNIRTIHQKNAGVSIARNAGIQAASGNWLCFVDADDWIASDMLKVMMEAVSVNIDLVVCSCLVYNKSKTETNIFYPEGIYDEKKDKEQIQLQLLSKGISAYFPQYVAVGVPWGKLYRKKIIEDHNLFFPENIDKYEDALFVFSFIEKCTKIKCINKNLYNYEVHQHSLSHGYKADIIEVTRQANAEFKRLIVLYKKDQRFEQAYHIKNVMSVNAYFKQFIFHKKAHLTYQEKITYINNVVSDKAYQESLSVIDSTYLSSKEKVLYYLMKKRLYSLLIFIYTIL